MTDRQALDGLNVADFSWVVAGPLVTKVLAEHGATVVRVESMTRPDPVRSMFPFAGGRAGINRGLLFNAYNDGKYSLSLNLNHPRGLEVARRLVAWADVVIENFTPGSMEKWGLGYRDCCRLNPDVIMISLSMQGQDGPQALQVGFGHMLQAMGGFVYLVGWPDRVPVGYQLAYNDYVAAWIALLAILGSLDHRRRTGEGQYIDLSQFEAGLPFLGPALLDYTANGTVEQAQGNRSPAAAPHGVYRCRGQDRWCAIAVGSDAEWQAFCRAIGSPSWTRDPRFVTLMGRKRNEDELDRLVEKWTLKHEAEAVMATLQAAGVAAGVVKDCRDLCHDPQMEHRGSLWPMNHPEVGDCHYLSAPFKLSETPCQITRPSPCLGEHTVYVCTHILGLADEEFVGLLGEGVFE
jgi:benzylsuccinate CoA-transferase BbsF subunit